MKVGDYVRTEISSLNIQRIGKIKEIIGEYFIHTDIGTYDKENIIKSSPKIMSLIEENDLLKIEYYSLIYNERVTRLFEVDYKDKEFMTLKNAHCDFMLRNNEFNDEDKKLKPIIKSIVTYEQFKSMEYKVGDEE